MKHREASIALRRFGLGPKPGDMARIAADPRGYVIAALASPRAALIESAGLQPSHVAYAELQKAQMMVRESRTRARAADANDMAKFAKPAPPGPGAAAQDRKGADGAPKPGAIGREAFREEAAARLERAGTTDQPFLERLVMFWSNHFAVSASKGAGVRALAGGFEREAIRPHALGRFADMLRAVEQHPAMLLYLDNTQSVGPSSKTAQVRVRGLNENLAREILELHTLGVDGGYTQADVTSLAKVITGWSVADERIAANAANPGNPVRAANRHEIVPGRFVFLSPSHEPGAQTVLGKRYEDRGLATGEAVLADLARHPSTARHLARKLAGHFVSDDPPPALVARLEATFRKTDGDLGAMARTLAESPECWEVAPRKVVPPYDFTVSLVRAFDVKPRLQEMIRVASAIGQPLWQPPSPKGWPDDDDAWLGPAAIRERLRIAERIAREIDRKADPRATALDLIGDVVSKETRLAVERAETREQGFELLIMSPEFLRR